MKVTKKWIVENCRYIQDYKTIYDYGDHYIPTDLFFKDYSDSNEYLADITEERKTEIENHCYYGIFHGYDATSGFYFTIDGVKYIGYPFVDDKETGRRLANILMDEEYGNIDDGI